MVFITNVPACCTCHTAPLCMAYSIFLACLCIPELFSSQNCSHPFSETPFPKPSIYQIYFSYASLPCRALSEYHGLKFSCAFSPQYLECAPGKNVFVTASYKWPDHLVIRDRNICSLAFSLPIELLCLYTFLLLHFIFSQLPFSILVKVPFSAL